MCGVSFNIVKSSFGLIILIMDQLLTQSLMDAYFKGMALYAKISPFENHQRFHDPNQIDKYSHNFLFLNNQPIHHSLITNYIALTKSFGFTQWVTFSQQHQHQLLSYLHAHQPSVETLVMMAAPITTLLKRIQPTNPQVQIESLHPNHQTTFLNFNFALDLEYGETYAKGNGKRIYNVIQQNPLNAGFLLAKTPDKMVGQLGYYVFDSVGEIDEFYVAEDHQKQGVGKTLFHHAIQLLQTRKVKTIMLVTNPTSDAHKIYQRWGFEDVMSIYQTRIKF